MLVDTNNPRVNATNADRAIEFHGGIYFDTLNDWNIVDVESGGTSFARLAFGDPSGYGPVIAHANSWPFVVGHINQSTFLTTFGSISFTDEFRSDSANGFQVIEPAFLQGRPRHQQYYQSDADGEQFWAAVSDANKAFVSSATTSGGTGVAAWRLSRVFIDGRGVTTNIPASARWRRWRRATRCF